VSDDVEVRLPEYRIIEDGNHHFHAQVAMSDQPRTWRTFYSPLLPLSADKQLRNCQEAVAEQRATDTRAIRARTILNEWPVE
jgi:hypothetical protein